MEGHTTSVWCGTAVIPDLVRSGRTKRGSDVRQAEDKFSCQDMNKTHRKRKTAKLKARKESRQLPNRHPEHGGNKMESAGVCARCRIWKGGSVTVNEASNGAGLVVMPAGSARGLSNRVSYLRRPPAKRLQDAISVSVVRSVLYQPCYWRPTTTNNLHSVRWTPYSPGRRGTSYISPATNYFSQLFDLPCQSSQ
jgi:hypothetical protein